MLAPNKVKENIHLDVNYSDPPDKVLPPSKMAKLLHWYPDDLIIADSRTGLFTTFPQVCTGTKCPFNKDCPVYTDARYLGTPCIVERVMAFRMLIAFIKEMSITADNMTDIAMIGDLIKLSLLNRRLEIGLSQEDVVESLVTFNGNAKSETRGVNIRLEELRKNRMETNKLYDKLLVSREARRKTEMMEGKAQKDMISAITTLCTELNIEKGSANERRREVPSGTKIVPNEDE